MGAKILLTMSVWTLDIEKFTNKHVRMESDAVAVSVRPCQSNIFWKKDEAPGLFDLEKKFFFKATEWKILLMTV